MVKTVSEKAKYSLKQWLGVRELSQLDLSRVTGLSEQTISQFVNDPEQMLKAKYTTLRAIAKALGIDIQDIRGLD